MEEKMIEILKKQVELLDDIQTVAELSDWKEKTKIFICRIYRETSTQYKQFSSISAYPSFYTPATQPDVSGAVRKSRNLLNGFIEDIEIFGLPNILSQKEKTRNIVPNIINKIENNPNFSQSQTQNQTQTQNIKDIIKDELTPARLKEIEAILKEDESQETKLQKIGDILQKVGIGVTSSVLARIITSSMGIF